LQNCEFSIFTLRKWQGLDADWKVAKLNEYPIA